MGRSSLGGASSSFFVLVFFRLTAAVGQRELFLGHWRGADFMFEERDEVTDEAVVELDGALVLGERGGLGAEARDDVVAGFPAADGVRELAAAPMVGLEIPGV